MRGRWGRFLLLGLWVAGLIVALCVALTLGEGAGAAIERVHRELHVP